MISHESINAPLRFPKPGAQKRRQAAGLNTRKPGAPATHIPAPPSRRAAGQRRSTAPYGRSETVEGDLLKLFIRESRYRQVAVPTLTIAVLALCWNFADTSVLLTWFLAGVTLIALRIRFERRYAYAGAFDDAAVRARFVKAMNPLYLLSGALWGASTLLYVGRTHGLNMFSCGLILACVAALPLMGAACIPVFVKSYMNSLFATAIACLIGTSFNYPRSIERLNSGIDLLSVASWMFILVPVFYWWLLRSLARRMHAVQRAQFELQYDLTLGEQVAREMAETRSRFLSAAAHDLRQPTMALAIYAQQLVECPEDHLAIAPRIARASTAVSHLFDSLFDMAHLDSGTLKLRLEPVKIKDLLEDIREQFEAIAQAKSIELTAQSVDATIETDPVRLRRMIANVVSNAIKYSPPNTRVRIVARATHGSVRIRVSDQGLGIPPGDLDKVFDEFYRVNHQQALSEDGIGLGLSIVNRLAQLLHCQIQLQSEVGKGTHFAFVVDSRFDKSVVSQSSLGVG